MTNSKVTSEEVLGRRQRLTQELEARGLDCIFVASEANAVYFTGYETTKWANKSKPIIVVLTRGGPTYFVCHAGEAPSVELDAVEVEVRPYAGPEHLTFDDQVELDYQITAARELTSVLRELGSRTVGMELTWHFIPDLTQLAIDRIREGLPKVKIVDASAAIWALRRYKSDLEIAKLREAADIVDRGHKLFSERAHVGMTEREIGRLLQQCGLEAGADRVPYVGVIAGVERAPLGGPTDRRWEPGQLLGIDLCLQVNGYWGDFCRLYGGRSASTEQRDAYDKLTDRVIAGREAITPGATVEKVAQALVGEADNNSSWASRVGHGLGLEMPEPPSLNPIDTNRLEPRFVLCLEPNLTLAGIGYIIAEEEVVLTTEGGYELLSPPWPTELQILE